MTITDPVERTVAGAFIAAGVKFIHESEDKGQKFDFFLPGYGLYIECKQFSTPRTSDQIKDREDVIVIQGKHAAHQFSCLLADLQGVPA